MSLKHECVYSTNGRMRPIFVRGDVVDFDTVDLVGEPIPAGTVMMSTVSPVEDIRAGRATWEPVEGLKGRLYGVTAMRLVIGAGDMGVIKVTTEAFTGEEACSNALAEINGTIAGINRGMRVIAALV
jgi:hypothetical protein